MRSRIIFIMLTWVFFCIFVTTVMAQQDCSRVYSFLGATRGSALCFWIGEQTEGKCSSLNTGGFQLHQILIGTSGKEVITTRLRDEYPDWQGLESWIAKSGTLKSIRFEPDGGDWKLLWEGATLILTPGKNGIPDIPGRRVSVIHRVTAGVGTEAIEKVWLIPGVNIIFALTRLVGSLTNTAEGYILLKIKG